MKKHICERAGCNRTATVKLANGHRLCEDCAKEFRRKGSIDFLKKELDGHIGNCCDIYVYYPVKIKWPSPKKIKRALTRF